MITLSQIENFINSEKLSKTNPNLVKKMMHTIYLLTNKHVIYFAEMMDSECFNPVMIFEFSDGTIEKVEINKYSWSSSKYKPYDIIKEHFIHYLPYMDRKVREIAGDI